MGVSARLIGKTVQIIADIFRVAGLAMLEVARKEIERTFTNPEDAPRVESVRQAFREILWKAMADGQAAIVKAHAQVEDIGAEEAMRDLVRDLGGGMDDYRDTGVNRAALRRLTAEAAAPMRSAVFSALRTAEDVYREVVVAATPSTIVGETERRKSAQRALDAFADRGVTGFTDKAGRRWELATYVEMATRTQLARTMVDSHADKLLSLGKKLVIVSDIRRECSLCRPWEGKILSLDDSGTSGVVVEFAPLLEREIEVRVAGTLQEARRKGLLHPNCRHNIALYTPGVTRPPAKVTADPEGDMANQLMRHFEREIRKWKKRKAVAVSPAATALASRHISAYQKRAAALAKTSGVPRQTKREQITGAR